jgi:ligand-binding sensor protein
VYNDRICDYIIPKKEHNKKNVYSINSSTVRWKQDKVYLDNNKSIGCFYKDLVLSSGDTIKSGIELLDLTVFDSNLWIDVNQ